MPGSLAEDDGGGWQRMAKGMMLCITFPSGDGCPCSARLSRRIPVGMTHAKVGSLAVGTWENDDCKGQDQHVLKPVPDAHDDHMGSHDHTP